MWYLCHRKGRDTTDTVAWCNGNTKDSGPLIRGSSPCATAKARGQLTSRLFSFTAYTTPLDWNCKCRVSPTDKAPTALPDGSLKDEPKDGLANNPGKSGSLFDLHKHPYTKGQGLPTCPECRRQGLVKGTKLADDTSKLCPMHQLARTVSRDKEKKVTYKELCKRLLVTRRAENFETYLNINQPLKIEGKTYSEVRTVDKQLLHATRDTKVALGKTLPLEELLQRYKQDLLSFDEWRIDKTNSSIVTGVKYRDGAKALKYVFRLQRDRESKEYFLDFITIGVVLEKEVLQYKKIK